MALSDNITLACSDENRRGGWKNVWVANRYDVSSFTAGVSDHSYSSVTMASTATKFYKLDFEDETFSVETSPSRENGSSMKEVTATGKVPKLDKTKGKVGQQVMSGCKYVMIGQTYTNQAFVFGYDELLGTDAALAATVAEMIGAELQAENGYTFNFTGKSAELFREFTGTITTTSGTVTPASA